MTFMMPDSRMLPWNRQQQQQPPPMQPPSYGRPPQFQPGGGLGALAQAPQPSGMQNWGAAMGQQAVQNAQAFAPQADARPPGPTGTPPAPGADAVGNLPPWEPLTQWARAVDTLLQQRGLDPDSPNLMVQLARENAQRLGATVAGRAAQAQQSGFFADPQAQLAAMGETLGRLFAGQRVFAGQGEGNSMLQALSNMGAAGQQAGADLGSRSLAEYLQDPQDAGNMFSALQYGNLNSRVQKLASAPLKRLPQLVEEALRNGTYDETTDSALSMLMRGAGGRTYR